MSSLAPFASTNRLACFQLKEVSCFSMCICRAKKPAAHTSVYEYKDQISTRHCDARIYYHLRLITRVYANMCMYNCVLRQCIPHIFPVNPTRHLQSEGSSLPSSEYELIRHSVHVADPLLDLYFPAHKQEREVKRKGWVLGTEMYM